MRSFRVFALFLALFLPAMSREGQAAELCEEKTSEILKRLDLAQSDIKEITLVPRRQSKRDGGGNVTGYDAWIRLRSCEGAVIVDFSKLCRERQVYTRGDCKIEGLSAY